MIDISVGDLYDKCTSSFGTRTAIISGKDSFSFQDLRIKSYNLAKHLQNLQIVKGNTAAFLMSNCAEYLFCEYALAKIGAIRVPLAVLLNNSDHIYMVNKTKCKILFYHKSLEERVSAMHGNIESIEFFVCIGGDGTLSINKNQQLINFDSLIRVTDNGTDLVPVCINGEDLASIYFTGGTTGIPKGVMLSHRSWLYTVLIETLEFDIRDSEQFLYLTPLTHAGGCLLLPVLLKGGTCFISNGFNAETFFDVVRENTITSTFLVPSMIYMLLDVFKPTNRQDIESLRNIIYGAAPIALDKIKEALDKFGLIFTQLFGQTEAPMAITAMTRADHANASIERLNQILTSAGRPTFHTKIRFIDDEGRDCNSGVPGEILVQCANMMTGYFADEETTSKTIIGGWLHTGDIGIQDEEGFIYIVDRKKDMVISGGFNIYPREIEDVLFEHPEIKNAAVVGIPDSKWGEQVCGIVTLQDGSRISEFNIIDYVKKRKGSLMAPKSIKFWSTIPLTNLGKVDKKEIKKLIASGE
jgi:fatty-acyl-CoA synthase|tara:strand:- start:938 stop:2515 length:1578 start_codon:yes stop_codon:yes gene_type:complete